MRKRFLPLLGAVLCGISLLAGCGAKEDGVLFPEPNAIRFGGGQPGLPFEQGVLFEKNGEMGIRYLDFQSGSVDYFCALPNCTHKDSSCPAMDSMGLRGKFVAGGKFYNLSADLRTQLNEKENLLSYTSTMSVSGMDRQNAKEIGTYRGENTSVVLYRGRAVLFNLDIPASLRGGGFSSGSNDKAELYLQTLDLNTQALSEEVPIAEGYNLSLQKFLGAVGDTLYFRFLYAPQPVDYSVFEELSPEESIARFHDIYTTQYCAYDIAENQIRFLETGFPEQFSGDSDDIEPVYIYQGVIFYTKDEKLMAYDISKQKESLVYDGELAEAAQGTFAYDGAMYFTKSYTDFIKAERFRYDLKTGEVLELSSSSQGAAFLQLYGEGGGWLYGLTSSGMFIGDDSGEIIYGRAKTEDFLHGEWRMEICD